VSRRHPGPRLDAQGRIRLHGPGRELPAGRDEAGRRPAMGPDGIAVGLREKHREFRSCPLECALSFLHDPARTPHHLCPKGGEHHSSVYNESPM